MLPVPHLTDHRRRLNGGNNGSQHGTAKTLFPHFLCSLLHISGQIHRKPRAGDDHIRSSLHGLLHIPGVLLRSYHDIKAQDPIRGGLPGFFKLLMDGSQIGSHGILRKIRILKADLGRGNDPDPSGLCHSPRQGRKADPNAHAALDHRVFCRQRTDLQRL